MWARAGASPSPPRLAGRLLRLLALPALVGAYDFPLPGIPLNITIPDAGINMTEAFEAALPLLGPALSNAVTGAMPGGSFTVDDPLAFLKPPRPDQPWCLNRDNPDGCIYYGAVQVDDPRFQHVELVNKSWGGYRQWMVVRPEEANRPPAGSKAPAAILLHGLDGTPYWYTSNFAFVMSALNVRGWTAIIPMGRAISAAEWVDARGEASTPEGRGLGACCDETWYNETWTIEQNMGCLAGSVMPFDPHHQCTFACDHEAWDDGSQVGGFRDLLVQQDFEFMLGLRSWAIEHAHADESKVFLIGYSHGAKLVAKVGYQLGHLFAGISAVGGGAWNYPQMVGGTRVNGVLVNATVKGSSFPPEPPGRPVPFIAFCGVGDFVCDDDRLTRAGLGAGSFLDMMEIWRVHNKCDKSTIPRWDTADAYCEEYTHCEAPTVYCRHDRNASNGGIMLGHSWPGTVCPSIGYVLNGHPEPNVCPQPPTIPNTTRSTLNLLSHWAGMGGLPDGGLVANGAPERPEAIADQLAHAFTRADARLARRARAEAAAAADGRADLDWRGGPSRGGERGEREQARPRRHRARARGRAVAGVLQPE